MTARVRATVIGSPVVRAGSPARLQSRHWWEISNATGRPAEFSFTLELALDTGHRATESLAIAVDPGATVRGEKVLTLEVDDLAEGSVQATATSRVEGPATDSARARRVVIVSAADAT